MPKNPYNNLLFDHINGFEFFLVFWVQILSYLPILQEGTTAAFPALALGPKLQILYAYSKIYNTYRYLFIYLLEHIFSFDIIFPLTHHVSEVVSVLP